MILHLGERVFWGAPEVIYLEGTIRQLDEAAQSVVVHIERATPHSAHLIGSDIPFAANGVTPLHGEGPPIAETGLAVAETGLAVAETGLAVAETAEDDRQPLPARRMDDAQKIRSAAAVAVHQQYGYTLPAAQEQALIEQVARTISDDDALREKVIASMDAILEREF